MSGFLPLRIVLQGQRLDTSLVAAAAELLGATRSGFRGAAVATLDGIADSPAPQARLRLRELCDAAAVDLCFVEQPRPLADFRLAVMDMDSTMITIECIDEIADMQGLKPQVSAITERAMRGELDYPASLRQRVALLRGLPVAALERVYEERLRLSPGAETMLSAFRAAGLKTLLVSGGFTFFASRLRERLGLDEARANTIGVRDGLLTGEVEGEIVDAGAKRRELVAMCARICATPDQAIAIGDGANDLDMMGAAGVSIAYHAKPVVRERATHAISHNGLDAVAALFAA
jgi:phosphoserine phosphatase